MKPAQFDAALIEITGDKNVVATLQRTGNYDFMYGQAKGVTKQQYIQHQSTFVCQVMEEIKSTNLLVASGYNFETHRFPEGAFDDDD